MAISPQFATIGIRFYGVEIFVPGWWNGRHGGFKILCPNGRVGSNPTLGTNIKTANQEYVRLMH